MISATFTELSAGDQFDLLGIDRMPRLGDVKINHDFLGRG
jgi:hypothetical protein